MKDLDYLAAVMNPEFFERDGCIFFAAHFSEEVYKSGWQKLVHLDREKTESTLNHVHLADLVKDAQAQRHLGEKIKAIWEERLSRFFPGRKCTVTLAMSQEGWTLELSSHPLPPT